MRSAPPASLLPRRPNRDTATSDALPPPSVLLAAAALAAAKGEGRCMGTEVAPAVAASHDGGRVVPASDCRTEGMSYNVLAAVLTQGEPSTSTDRSTPGASPTWTLMPT